MPNFNKSKTLTLINNSMPIDRSAKEGSPTNYEIIRAILKIQNS